MSMKKLTNKALHGVQAAMDDPDDDDDPGYDVYFILQKGTKRIIQMVPDDVRTAIPPALRPMLISLESDDLIIEGDLGHGAFGTVKKGRYKGTPVAIKFLDVEHARQTFTEWTQSEVNQNFFWEAQGMLGIDHPSVVRMFAVAVSTDRNAIIFELCGGGELAERITASPPMNADQMWSIAMELSEGLVYLHQQGRVHRDIKPENILLDCGYAKFGDLGVAQLDISVVEEEAMATAQGLQDRKYGSPEASRALLQGTEVPTNKATDVYSFGLTLLHVCVGGVRLWPPQMDIRAIVECIAQNGVEQVITIHADWVLAPVIRACLQSAPEDRPATEEIPQMLARVCPSPTLLLAHTTRMESSRPVQDYGDNYAVEERAKARLSPSDDEKEYQTASAMVDDFLGGRVGDGDEQVLVLFGEGGTGKSTLLRLKAQTVTDYTVVLIRPGLPSWSRSCLINGIDTCLDTYGARSVSNDERLLFLVDGYDELTLDDGGRVTALSNALGLHAWRNSKLIVTCRPNTVPIGEETTYFGDRCIVRQLLPFTAAQTRAYLSKFNVELDDEKLLPILENPLVLSLYTQCADLITDDPCGRVLTRHIYEAFFRKWAHGIGALMPEVQALLSLPKLYEYVGRVAMSMFMNDSQTWSVSEVNDGDDIWRDVKRLTEYNARTQRRQQQQQQQQERRQVLSEDDYVAIKMSSVNALMDSCVLHEKGDGTLAFTHKSFRDYFCAHFMLMDADRRMNDDHDDIHESALCLKLVTKDVSVLRWCAWHVNMDTVVAYQSPFAATDDDESKSPSSSCFLWDIINESKRRDDIAVAAANCLSILNTAGVSMCGRDFTGIHAGGDYDEHGNVPFADLGGARLIGAILRHADLRGARLQQAQLDACDLRNANLSGVEFGEMPMCLGHTDKVNSVAVSGDFVFSGSDDMSVKQLRISTGELIRTLEGHTREVTSVAVSGDFVFSGSYDRTVKQWRISTGELLRTLESHSGPVTSVTVSGNFVFSGSYDDTIKQWRISTGELVRTLNDHTHWVCSVGVSGDFVFSGSQDKSVKQWRISSGELVRTLHGHDAAVTSIAVCGDFMFSGSDDESVKQWRISTGELIRTLEGHTDKVTCVAVSGDFVFSGSYDCTVKQWRISTGELIRTLDGHTDKVTCVAVSGDFVLSGSYDMSVKQWRSYSEELVRPMKGHSRMVRSVAVSGDFIFSGSDDETVKQWVISTGELIRTLEGHTNKVTSVAVSGDFLFSAAWGNVVKKWRILSGECVETHESAHISWFVDAEELSDNRLVVFYDGSNVGVKHEGLIVWLSSPYRLSAKDALVFGVECSPVQKRLLLQLGADV